MLMQALSAGWPGSKTILGAPPPGKRPFAVSQQRWLAVDLIPEALKVGRPFYHMDNGYIAPGRGDPHGNGYYRITYRGMSPILMRDAPATRIPFEMKPWRKTGSHVILALPGEHYGRAMGLDMEAWISTSMKRLQGVTDRRIRCRHKLTSMPLATDLRDCWAVMTHSSNIAVDAVLAGIPVFVAPTNPAAPVGNLDIADIERPLMPDRAAWFDSLMAQQFSLPEMRSGFAREMLGRVKEQVDG